MFPLKNHKNPIDKGKFGAIRKHDIHTGIDFYCENGDKVYCIEDGVVLKNIPFTGSLAGSEWWCDTNAVLVKGASGVILYGELESKLECGDNVNEGDIIGVIKTVLKKDKGNGVAMLHLELYDEDYSGEGEIWELHTEKPNKLKDPNTIFYYKNNIMKKKFEIEVEYLQEWLSNEECLYAASSKERKRLVCGLNGIMRILVAGDERWRGTDPAMAVDVYNSITEKYVDEQENFKL